MTRTFEVTMRTVAKTTMRTEGAGAQEVVDRLRRTMPRGTEIMSVVQTDPPLDPDHLCAECEALRVKAEAEPTPPPEGAPPTGSPTGGAHPALLQEAA